MWFEHKKTLDGRAISEEYGSSRVIAGTSLQLDETVDWERLEASVINQSNERYLNHT